MLTTQAAAAVLLLLLAAASLSGAGSPTSEEEDNNTHSIGRHRDKKLLNLFSVVRFKNNVCIGTNNLNGTCYTSVECSQRGGTSAGSCASGYGVCCTFTVNCGATSSENCTYFQSSGTEGAGQCRIRICKCNNNICQLRLDFNTFVITGPSTTTATETMTLNGAVNTGGTAANTRTRCMTDTFSVTNPGGSSPPQICGTNTGEHMYVDASDACNELAFQLGNTGVGATLATRSWNIKITQYSCDYNNLAPDGCTQYFFGTTTQAVRTYNYNGGAGTHLADQNQNICIRRERGNCRICWTAQNNADFGVSGKTASVGVTGGLTCCGYGADGKGTKGFDCVQIPGLSKATNSAMLAANAICGTGMGLVSATAGAATTVCSKSQPFNLRFLSDSYEVTGEFVLNPMRGFELVYIQTNC